VLQAPRTSLRPFALLAIPAVLIAAAPLSVSAHSGASSVQVDQEVHITIGRTAINIEYATTLNRPAAFLEVIRIDTDEDGGMSPAEQDFYFTRLGETLAAGLEMSVNGRQVPLEPVGRVELAMPFTKTYRFAVPHPVGWTEGADVEFHNDNYLAVPGKVEVTLDPGDGADIVHHRLEGQALGDSSGAGLLSSQERDVVFRYRKGTGRHAPVEGPEAVGLDRSNGMQGGAGATPHSRKLLLVLLVVSGIYVVVMLLRRTAMRHSVAVAAAVLGLGACLAVLFFWSHGAAVDMPDDTQAAGIFRRLHEGIYRAFNAQTEDEIYDALACSLEGELLDKVYNEVHEAVMVRAQNRSTFRVRRVKAISTEVRPAGEGGRAFRVRHHWRGYGTVSHLAHTHARFNEYQAIYTVRHNGRTWRICDSEVRRHKRVSIGQS